MSVPELATFSFLLWLTLLGLGVGMGIGVGVGWACIHGKAHHPIPSHCRHHY